jgi:hypothetical protein
MNKPSEQNDHDHVRTPREQAKPSSGELPDRELDKVSGGVSNSNFTITKQTDVATPKL